MIESSLVGVWNSTIFHQTMPIILLAHFFLNGDEIAGYLDIPSKENTKIRIDMFQNRGQKIIFNSTLIGFSFNGYIQNNSNINGIVNAFSDNFSAHFEKIRDKSEYSVSRPQTPKKPYPYYVEEVVIENKKANILLSGTFTYPKNQKPLAAVVLCHGSGGNDRDETIFDHKPFKVIADYLTKNNIAVLRYDERGIRNSTGDFLSATDIDFADDAILGIEFLKNRRETSKSKLGLVGHSKGGPTSMIASNRSNLVEFMALLGSPSILGMDLLTEQNKLILKSQNFSERTIKIRVETNSDIYKIIVSEKNDTIAKTNILEYLEGRLNDAVGQDKIDLENFSALLNRNNGERTIDRFLTPWFRSILEFDPTKILEHVKIPVLGIWGTNDLQVPPYLNLKAMNSALTNANNKNFKLIEIDGLNHAFQKSATGSIEEYSQIEETFSEEVLEIIKDWIVKQSGY